MCSTLITIETNRWMDFVDRLTYFLFFKFYSELFAHLLFTFFLCCFRPNSNASSPTSDNLESSSTSQTPAPLNRQSSDELSAQQGKRKFSLSQYKEHKRLKSNEIQGNTLADTDMRLIHMENSKVRTSAFSQSKISIIPLALATNDNR